MPVTESGIVVERQAEIFYDVAEKIRNSGAFGSLTVLDDPDQFAADPFVQTVVALTASDSDTWLALEWLQNQLDPNTASGRYLIDFHLSRWGIDATGLNETEAKALLFQLKKNGVKTFSPEVAVMQMPQVAFAKTYYSKFHAPVNYLNPGETMIVVMPKPNQIIPQGVIAQALFDGIGDGFYNWVGDTQDIYEYRGNCYPYFYQPADRVVIAVKFYGNLNECSDAAWHNAANTLMQKANCALQYELGAKLDGQALLQLLGETPGININRIEIQRRPKPLTGSECLADAESLTFTSCSGVESSELWASDKVCGYAQCEIWCKDFVDCLILKPWEFATFHASFFEFIEEASPC